MDLRRLAERPLPDQAFFLNVVIGMAKDAGYTDPEQFIRVVRFAWPHVKEPKLFNFESRREG